MERVRKAVAALNPQAAYLVSDRAVELLLNDGRRIRITAAESLKSGGFSADHEVAIPTVQDGRTATVWGDIDLPWAEGKTAEDCLAHAILLMIG